MLQRTSGAVLALLLVTAATLWWRTAPPSTKATRAAEARISSATLVDESTFAAARRLSMLAVTPEEQSLAQTALRVADHDLALAFTAALRELEAHPPTLTAEALKVKDRLQKSEQLLDSDQQRVAQLTADLARSKAAQRDALQDELQLANSQLELDKDELDEANQDLVAAGGNPQQRIEALIEEHEAQIKAHTAVVPAGLAAAGAMPHGSLEEARDWLQITRKRQQLGEARDSAADKAEDLKAQRAALAALLDQTKGGIAELAHHTKEAKTGGADPAAAAASTAPHPPHTHDDATILLQQTKLITAQQRVLTVLDRQTADLRQLAGVYQQWGAVAALQSNTLAHQLLFDAGLVIATLLAALALDQWAQRLLNSPKLDRRQIETLRSLTRVGLRVVAVMIILLILIGMPRQFGTMLGIVGAGLTVALKDFIVAFFGWLVLMGRNGIRLGDWVEINGVSGEVTQLGMFHTVLLETGNWSNAGHPTGRRVTFTNSFAIEGHYFNFSTSGQWLWDELQVVVPAGQDPYPIVAAITQQVTAATAESSAEAAQEWQRAVPSQRGKTFSGVPGVNVKPVVGGVEIAVRYLTRANERFQLRATLYQGAVDLLAAKQAASATG